jgi:hypothetical protein
MPAIEAVLMMLHHPRGVLHADDGGAQVDGNALLVSVDRHLGDAAYRTRPAGIVEHHVELAVLLDRVVDQRGDFRLDRAVDLPELRLAAECLGDRFAFRHPAAAEDHRGALGD